MFWDPSRPLFKGHWGSFPGLKWGEGDVILTTRSHEVSKLGMSGAIRLLPLYNFMAWIGTNVIFHYLLIFFRWGGWTVHHLTVLSLLVGMPHMLQHKITAFYKAIYLYFLWHTKYWLSAKLSLFIDLYEYFRLFSSWRAIEVLLYFKLMVPCIVIQCE